MICLTHFFFSDVRKFKQGSWGQKNPNWVDLKDTSKQLFAFDVGGGGGGACLGLMPLWEMPSSSFPLVQKSAVFFSCVPPEKNRR